METQSRELEMAYQEWERLPMPKINEDHLYDRSRFELEDDALRGQTAWVARKYGVEYKDLDKLIENLGVCT